MDGSEAELHDALDRIMQIWSKIKMVPEADLSVTRASVSALLAEHRHLSEKELLVLGFKHLYRTDGLTSGTQQDVDAASIRSG